MRMEGEYVGSDDADACWREEEHSYMHTRRQPLQRAIHRRVLLVVEHLAAPRDGVREIVDAGQVRRVRSIERARLVDAAGVGAPGDDGDGGVGAVDEVRGRGAELVG